MCLDRLKIWPIAFRPKTLSASVAPVLLGTAMAAADGVADWPTALVALFGALSIQIGTNLANDYFDFKKGADTAERIGPLRVTQAGLISPGAMKCAIVLTFGLAALAAVALIIQAGWPIVVIAVLSILSGIFYTAGPRPLGYVGLGEIFVLIFFGPVAVGGTYYVQSLEIHSAVILAGIPLGLLSAAILAVNNLRDIETDRKSGKQTLAVRFGKDFAKIEYLVFVIAAALLPILIYGMAQDHRWILAAPVILLLAVPGIHAVFTKSDGPALNKTLAYTGVILLVYSIIFAIGWAI